MNNIIHKYSHQNYVARFNLGKNQIQIWEHMKIEYQFWQTHINDDTLSHFTKW